MSKLGDSQTISGSMQAANEMRRKWLTSIVTGEVNFRDVVSLSYNPEYKPLLALRLLSILSEKPGWSESTAIEAMRHAGLDTKETVQSIRKSSKKTEIFDVMISSAQPGQWRMRPNMPEGWPWRGKLSILTKECGVSYDEIDELFKEIDTEEESPEDVLPRRARRHLREQEESSIIDSDIEDLFK